MTLFKLNCLAAILAGAAITLPDAVAAHETAGAQRSITVFGSGDAAGPPDLATVQAGVQTLAPTVVEASRQNQAIVERIMQALAQQGVDEKDIQTADYGIWPEQQHDPRGSGEATISGYRVNNTVRITIRDIERVAKLLSAVTTAGANSIHGIQFSVEDTASLEAEAQAVAMANARQRAEALAALAGVTLGNILDISMSPGGSFPAAMGGGDLHLMREAPTPGISAGQLRVSVQVQVRYAIR